MGKALNTLTAGLVDSLAPKVEPVTPADIASMLKRKWTNLFRHMHLDHIVYRGGKVIVMIGNDRTNEDKKSCRVSHAFAERCLQTYGFYLPITFEDWKATIEALQAGEYMPSVNQFGRWGLWPAHGDPVFGPTWNAISNGRLAIVAACGWSGLPLPSNAGEALAVLNRWDPMSFEGEWGKA